MDVRGTTSRGAVGGRSVVRPAGRIRISRSNDFVAAATAACLIGTHALIRSESTGFCGLDTGFCRESTGFRGLDTGLCRESTGFRGVDTGFCPESTGVPGGSFRHCCQSRGYRAHPAVANLIAGRGSSRAGWRHPRVVKSCQRTGRSTRHCGGSHAKSPPPGFRSTVFR